MEISRVSFVFLISAFSLLRYSDVVTGAILSRPELVYLEGTCGENEVFSQCQANQDCVKSCDNLDIWESVPCIQTKSCLSGCICAEGYVRDKNQDICVMENSCPRVRH
ncbi:PREDICTED: allergen Api m 6-like [Habropoda laboriosa]|uniref:allergen Api m 6-like n=1 Tax=Habropoda laboriosa TaxID=597456 RepID=UPI00083E596E|nr:PREDICTED: allergen Api m 6-like [Habropoda laboriosa]